MGHTLADSAVVRYSAPGGGERGAPRGAGHRRRYTAAHPGHAGGAAAGQRRLPLRLRGDLQILARAEGRHRAHDDRARHAAGMRCPAATFLCFL